MFVILYHFRNACFNHKTNNASVCMQIKQVSIFKDLKNNIYHLSKAQIVFSQISEIIMFSYDADKSFPQISFERIYSNLFKIHDILTQLNTLNSFLEIFQEYRWNCILSNLNSTPTHFVLPLNL